MSKQNVNSRPNDSMLKIYCLILLFELGHSLVIGILTFDIIGDCNIPANIFHQQEISQCTPVFKKNQLGGNTK